MKILIAILLAIMMAQAVILGNYILGMFSVVAAIAVIHVARQKVKEVITDERDLQLAGKAARLSLAIFSVVGAVATFVFIEQGKTNTVYGSVGSTLAYSVCSLLLLYSVILTYYEKQN